MDTCVEKCPFFYQLQSGVYTCIDDCNPGYDPDTNLKLTSVNGDNIIDFVAKYFPDKKLCHHKCYPYTLAGGYVPGNTPDTYKPILDNDDFTGDYVCRSSCATSNSGRIFRQSKTNGNLECVAKCSSGIYRTFPEGTADATTYQITSADVLRFDATDENHDHFCIANEAACDREFIRWDVTNQMWRCTSIKDDPEDFVIYSTKDNTSATPIKKHISKNCTPHFVGPGYRSADFDSATWPATLTNAYVFNLMKTAAENATTNETWTDNISSPKYCRHKCSTG